jgi:hypothetical protein
LDSAKYRKKLAKSKELTIYEYMLEYSKDTLVIVDMQLGFLPPARFWLRYYKQKRKELIGRILKEIDNSKTNDNNIVLVEYE